MIRISIKAAILLIGVVASSSYAMERDSPRSELLHVASDSTRELYKEYNAYFRHLWKKRTGQDIEIYQSHGGSAKQARAVIAGLRADVISLALSYDMHAIAARGNGMDRQWEQLYPNQSSPYYSTIIFLVRKGNPLQIQDWHDLIRPSISLVMASPKVSGGARWNYLAAYAYAVSIYGDREEKIYQFLCNIYQNVTVMDHSARAASNNFVKRHMGDVLVTWENEALQAKHHWAKDEVEIIYPSRSIRANMPVSWHHVGKNKENQHHSVAVKAYIAELFAPEGQHLIARHYFRPYIESILALYRDQFPKIALTNIENFGDWTKIHQRHFADGGWFDQMEEERAHRQQKRNTTSLIHHTDCSFPASLRARP
jgi:sulfate/thiosulfate-binding protein